MDSKNVPFDLILVTGTMINNTAPHRVKNTTLSNSMQQRPSSEANRFSASQEIPRILWNPMGHYRIQMRPPPVPILNHINSAQAPIPLLDDSF